MSETKKRSPQNHEIVLAPGTKFVRTLKIPALIAEALYPRVPGESRMIRSLEKTEKTNPWRARRHTIESLLGQIINHDDKVTLNVIWKGLPKLELPLSQTIAEATWKSYAAAFQKNGEHLDWELVPEFDPQSSPAAFRRDQAKIAHDKRLRAAIGSGGLEQLDPTSNIPTTSYLTSGKVSVDALTNYVKQFHIDVRCGVRKVLGRPRIDTTVLTKAGNYAKTFYANHPNNAKVFPQDVSMSREFVSHMFPGKEFIDQAVIRKSEQAYLHAYGVSGRKIRDEIAKHWPGRKKSHANK